MAHQRKGFPRRRREPGDVEQRLVDAGRAPAPVPNRGFVDALESRLRSQHTGGVAGTHPVVRARSGSPRALALAAAAVVVVGLAVVAVRGPGPAPAPQTQAIRLAAAVDTVVVQPGGEVVAARAGTRLRDGAIVETGPAGRAVLDGTVLGPNRRAVVTSGVLVPSPAARPAPQAQPPAARPPAQPRPERPRPALLPTTTVRPRPDPTPTTSTTGRPPPEPPAERSPALRLVARAQTGANQMRWTPYDGPNFYAYVVLRADDPNSPEYPPSDSTHMVGASRERDASYWTDRNDRGTAVTYLVVAVDEEGRELARSNLARPEMPSR